MPKELRTAASIIRKEQKFNGSAERCASVLEDKRKTVEIKGR